MSVTFGDGLSRPTTLPCLRPCPKAVGVDSGPVSSGHVSAPFADPFESSPSTNTEQPAPGINEIRTRFHTSSSGPVRLGVPHFSNTAKNVLQPYSFCEITSTEGAEGAPYTPGGSNSTEGFGRGAARGERERVGEGLATNVAPIKCRIS
ncbi:hypothetical protein EVAR_42820_1 [Eumeta japonica]|uniref:Uncharacterized protein n=1 Tax=Eumeta variegata TaxID=151549 RepID=A0A4C1WIF8_EUMVA|nr:hypothetical protein EVAR_42820_1 [Eumeta japonica]